MLKRDRLRLFRFLLSGLILLLMFGCSSASPGETGQEPNIHESAPAGHEHGGEAVGAGEGEQPDNSTEATGQEGQLHVVEIVNFGFSPASLTVKPGDRVQFINKDQAAHSATADDRSFDTGMLGRNEYKEITFSTAGQFSYFCLPHPGMKGTIIVAAD